MQCQIWCQLVPTFFFLISIATLSHNFEDKLLTGKMREETTTKGILFYIQLWPLNMHVANVFTAITHWKRGVIQGSQLNESSETLFKLQDDDKPFKTVTENWKPFVHIHV